MYDELVAWLRSWSELPAHCKCYESCDECDRQDLCSTFTNESIITKAGEAADAIEALSKLALDEHNRAAVATWENRWIPVTDRLPDGEVLAVNALPRSFGYHEYLIGYICEDPGSDTGFFCGSNDAILTNVTHWMPLPQPPEEE